MTYKAVISAVVFSYLILMSTAVRTSIPGWGLTGSNPKSYSTGIFTAGGESGGAVAYLRGNDKTDGFGTLMQMFNATKYEGQRVRLSANISTDKLNQTAGLWMRMDGAYSKILAFDNMQDRPITGTTDWRRYEIVLDVPMGTRRIAFGVLMVDGGLLRMESVKLEIVPPNVPMTGTNGTGPQSALTINNDIEEPNNLDFKLR